MQEGGVCGGLSRWGSFCIAVIICITLAVYKLELRSSDVVSRRVIEAAYIAIECGLTVVVYPPPQLCSCPRDRRVCGESGENNAKLI